VKALGKATGFKLSDSAVDFLRITSGMYLLCDENLNICNLLPTYYPGKIVVEIVYRS